MDADHLSFDFTDGSRRRAENVKGARQRDAKQRKQPSAGSDISEKAAPSLASKSLFDHATRHTHSGQPAWSLVGLAQIPRHRLVRDRAFIDVEAVRQMRIVLQRFLVALVRQRQRERQRRIVQSKR